MIKKFNEYNNITFKGSEPDWIKQQITNISVDYIDFNGNKKTGEIICNIGISKQLKKIFDKLLIIKFPIYNISPISNYDWDDDLSCEANNTSCFNWRKVLGSDKLSDHSIGMAIDINPMQNPWVTNKFGNLPKGSKYDLSAKGTITEEIANIFKQHGFLWGGDWKNPDYQHFYKKI